MTFKYLPNEKYINDANDIQEAIDELANAGGGTVYLAAGTYTLTENINVKGGVRLKGVSRDEVTIDCSGGYSVTVSGENAYEVGTVSITTDATTVTGTGTTFTQDMVGQYIYLSGQWYEVDSVTNATSLEIGWAFSEDDLVNDPYVICDPNWTATVETFTIVDAPGTGLILQYTSETTVEDVLMLYNNLGMSLYWCNYPRMEYTCIENNSGIDFLHVDAFEVNWSETSFGYVGNGVSFEDVHDGLFMNATSFFNPGVGMYLDNCSKIAFLSVTLLTNDSHGLHVTNGCQSLQFFGVSFEENAANGVLIDGSSSEITFTGNSMSYNDVYGMEIDASCTNIVVVSNTFTSNMTDNLLDNTTDSTIRVNAGIPDTPIWVTSTKTANYTLTKEDNVVLFDATSGDLTATLPASPRAGRRYDITKIDTGVNTVTIDGNGNTINGDATRVIQFFATNVTVVYSGSEWRVI